MLWEGLVTLEAMLTSKQLDSPLVQHNPDLVRDLIAAYDLNLDLWDAIPMTEFSNSAIHITPEGGRQLAGLISDAISRALQQSP